MTVEKTYIAEDGRKFEFEYECRKHEDELKENKRKALLQEIIELDEKIWKKYHPDYKDENRPNLQQAVIWLNYDISHILYEFPDSETDILAIIKKSVYGDEIIEKYLNLDKAREKASIRRDFTAALKSVKYGSQLSSKLDWSFTDKDLKVLAELHKAGKFRKKIEDLLEDCNFHSECGKFINHDYDEFLK